MNHEQLWLTEHAAGLRPCRGAAIGCPRMRSAAQGPYGCVGDSFGAALGGKGRNGGRGSALDGNGAGPPVPPAKLPAVVGTRSRAMPCLAGLGNRQRLPAKDAGRPVLIAAHQIWQGLCSASIVGLIDLIS